MVSESFLPHVNGVTGSVLQVLRHLRVTGHEALVVAAGDPPRTCEGFDVVALPSVGFPGYPQVRVPIVLASRLVRELAGFAPDVIHLASPFVLGGPRWCARPRRSTYPCFAAESCQKFREMSEVFLSFWIEPALHRVVGECRYEGGKRSRMFVLGHRREGQTAHFAHPRRDTELGRARARPSEPHDVPLQSLL